MNMHQHIINQIRECIEDVKPECEKGSLDLVVMSVSSLVLGLSEQVLELEERVKKLEAEK